MRARIESKPKLVTSTRISGTGEISRSNVKFKNKVKTGVFMEHSKARRRIEELFN